LLKQLVEKTSGGRGSELVDTALDEDDDKEQREEEGEEGAEWPRLLDLGAHGLGMTHISLEDDEEPRRQSTPPPPHSVIAQLFERLGTLSNQLGFVEFVASAARRCPEHDLGSRVVKGTARRPSSADGSIATIEMAEGKRTREDRIPTGPCPRSRQGWFSYKYF
jgi:hypothetical protein